MIVYLLNKIKLIQSNLKLLSNSKYSAAYIKSSIYWFNNLVSVNSFYKLVNFVFN